MADALMACEVLAEREIVAAFVGHHGGFSRDIGLDDRDYNGRASSLDMERANLPAVTVNERKDRVLVAMPAPFDCPILAANKSFIRFNGAANPAHRCKASRAHRFAKTMAHEPSGLKAHAKRPMKLIARNALLARAHEKGGLKPDMQLDWAILEKRSLPDGKLLPAIIAFFQAKALTTFLVLYAFERGNAAHTTAVRTYRTFRAKR